MKKLIILFALVPILLSAQENKESKFIELNIGLAAIDGYDFNDAFQTTKRKPIQKIIVTDQLMIFIGSNLSEENRKYRNIYLLQE